MLTPEQIAQYRQQYGITGEAASTDPSERINAMRQRVQAFGGTVSEPISDQTPSIFAGAEGFRAQMADPSNLAAGFVKGIGSFGQGAKISPFQTGQRAIAGIAGKQNQKTQESIKNFQGVADRILEVAQQTTDPEKREQLFDLAHEALSKVDTVQGVVRDTTKRLGELESFEIAEELQPKGRGQNIGYFTEKLGEFLLPTSIINKANRILGAGIGATKIAQKGGTLGKLLATGVKIAGKAGIEGTATYGVSKFQGATDEEAMRNAKFAGYISGGLGVVGAVANATGGKLYQIAQKVYRSGLKPSSAGPKGAERAASNVQTGLREGIILSNRGVQKTAEVIDDLEGQLDDAIRVAKGSGKAVSTQGLKPYIDEVKGVVANTLDVKGSQIASQHIDDLWENLVKKYGDDIPIEEAQQLKANTYKVLRDSYDQLASPVREGLKQLTRGVKEGILEVAPQVGDINPRLSSLYKFDEALNKANARIQNLNLIGLGTKVLAATGGKTGAALGIVDAIVGSPAAKSHIGITLYRLGNILQKLAPEQIGQVSASPGVKSLLQRAFGAQAELTDEEMRYAKAIKEYLDNPKVGLGIEDVSKKASGAAGTPEAAMIQEARKYKSAEEFVKAQTTSKSWSEAQKTNPELWNTGILRRSQNPMGAKGIIPDDVHSAQAKWQNYGQNNEMPAKTVYKRIESGSYKGEYEDKFGNAVRDENGSILRDEYDDATGEWIEPMVSNKQLKDNLLESFSTKEGKDYLNRVIEALPKNPDGTVTAYRIGAIGEGPQSYTLSEGMAKTFSNQGTDILPAGVPGLPKGGYKDFGVLPANTVKIDPKGIVAWSPYDAEILVEQKFVKTKSQLTDLWNQANQ